MKLLYLILILVANVDLSAQRIQRGMVINRITQEIIPGATVMLDDSSKTIVTNGEGRFDIQITTQEALLITAIGFEAQRVKSGDQFITISMKPSNYLMGEVVVTGTMKAVQKTASPVPVEVYSPQFFRKNPSPAIFEALQMINGVRPQLNCNVCNTGDIHINGLEGPYTMVLIDGMPIVSSLSSVYGLSGIPNSLVERIEVVKGPASSLYGSEAIGGLINVITKTPKKAPLFSFDLSTTSWNEHNVDASVKYKISKNTDGLLGINYFNFSDRTDKNGDNFTDITLQHRISAFNKFSWRRPENRIANLAVRYVYEDRWGGDMRWSKQFRGGDSIYGESIYTSRVELIGNYQLPVAEKIIISYSFNSHSQRSVYGKVPFNALQKIGFVQATWDKHFTKHDLLSGLVFRYNWYDDNTTATTDTVLNQSKADKAAIPGVFVQDEITLNPKQKLLIGGRLDYHPIHKYIFTPRVAWKYSVGANDVVRVNAGTGFRTVNLFTEDHAALTGARDVIIRNKLKPERSYNINLNYVKKIYTNSFWLNLDGSIWYTHFTNRILPDYTTNTNQIIYDNLSGYSLSKGISLNTEVGFTNSLRGHWGFTIQDVTIVDKALGNKNVYRQLLTEKWSSSWSLSYSFNRAGISLDYTGNVYGKMLLPVLSQLDPRAAESPVWSLHNLQFTKKFRKGFELYTGVKNIFNWTPAKHSSFLIARSHDPFDKNVKFDSGGQPVATAENPYALTFDPNYVYAPNQGRRGYLGIRFQLND
ncbi:MAG: TonB-dependent receptor [Chitinophagaceae bacterium]|nr:TonB-dependent receptor [Chitinophagaceae bacterium]